MIYRSLLALLFVAMLNSTSRAGSIDIVVDDFESYTSNTDLLNAWAPFNGTSFFADNGTMLTSDPDNFYGDFIDGQAVEFCGSEAGSSTCGGISGGGSVNRWNTPFSIAPSPTQNIELSVDLGDDALSANSRLAIGLRSTSPSGNLVEMGLYNNPNAGFNYRAQLFGVGGEENPNWVNFNDAENMDSPLQEGIDTQNAIGAGFHRFKAVISTDQIVFSLDIYADGLTNDPLDPVRGVGTPGVDAMDTVFVVTTVDGFNDLRFGIPSHLPSSGIDNPDAAYAAFDNISLRLVDIETNGNSDADNDGDVDGADFLQLQRNNPELIAQWELDYAGNNTLLGASSVPEPVSGTLALLAVLGLLAVRRS